MNCYLRQGRRPGVKASSDKLVGMMRDLDLALRIVDDLQDREYLTNEKEIEARESRLALERGKFALDVLRDWVENGDVKRYPEAAMRVAMMLNIPADRIEAVVDDLAHVYERRYEELAIRSIAKQQQLKEQSRQSLNALFTKKQFSLESHA